MGWVEDGLFELMPVNDSQFLVLRILFQISNENEDGDNRKGPLKNDGSKSNGQNLNKINGKKSDGPGEMTTEL